MSRLFANGTEGYAWEAVWCHHCIHNDDCEIQIAMLCEPDDVPDQIIEEPEGDYYLPALHICKAFTPGPDGDPVAGMRADVTAYVTQARGINKETTP